MREHAGVYVITHVPTHREYIGSSADVRHRWRVHRYQLRRGTHPARALQAAWDTDGEEALSFALLTPYTSAAARLAAERATIRKRRPAFNSVTKHKQGCMQRGEGIMTASGASGRVPLTVRVDASLRDQAKATSEERGLSLNDLVIAAISAYCRPAPAPDTPDLPATIGSSEQADELLRLAELMAADMHLVREVLHALHPLLEVEARTRTRSWISRLGIGSRGKERHDG